MVSDKLVFSAGMSGAGIIIGRSTDDFGNTGVGMVSGKLLLILGMSGAGMIIGRFFCSSSENEY